MPIKFNRRTFAKTFIGAGIIVGSFFAGKHFSVRLKSGDDRLRPPGAVNEDEFLATCIKCGQCVQVCPYHAVELLDISSGVALATPVIIPNKRGCYLCDLLPCVLSCPSGALDHNISDAYSVSMGKAVVTYPDKCLGVTNSAVSEDDIARLIAHGAKSTVEKELSEKLKKCAGKKCAICVDFCPYPEKDKAIEITEDGNGYRPTIKDSCVGCGVCAELCPTKVFEIKADRNRNV